MKHRISQFFPKGKSKTTLHQLMTTALILCLFLTMLFPAAAFAADGTDGDNDDAGTSGSTYEITISYIQGSDSWNDVQQITPGESLTLTWFDPLVNINGENVAFIGWFRDADCNEALNITGTDQLYTPERDETLFCVWKAVGEIPKLPDGEISDMSSNIINSSLNDGELRVSWTSVSNADWYTVDYQLIANNSEEENLCEEGIIDWTSKTSVSMDVNSYFGQNIQSYIDLYAPTIFWIDVKISAVQESGDGQDTAYQIISEGVRLVEYMPPELAAQVPENLADTVTVQDLNSDPQSRRDVEERIHLYDGNAFTFNDSYTLGVYRNDDPSIQLTQGTDYDVSYANNTASGTMTVTVTGKGSYDGVVTKHVRIAPVTSIKIEDLAFSNKKNPPLIGTVKALVDGTEKTLQQGTDYILDYGDGSLTIGDHTTILFGIGDYAGMATSGTYRMVGSITDTTVTFPAQAYTGKTLKPAPVIKLNNAYSWMEPLKEGTDYTITYTNNKNAGTASATITGKGYYKGVRRVNFTIDKAKNPMKLTGKTATVKYSKVKKKAQTIKLSKAVTVSKAKGTLTYKKTSGNNKITVNKKTGKITVKKGLKKGTYTIKIKITAAASNNYKGGSKTVKCRIKVK